MFECEIHGLCPAELCCVHLGTAIKRDEPIDLGILYDRYREPWVLCEHCLKIATAHAIAHHGTPDDYPVPYKGECSVHLDNWLKKWRNESGEEFYARFAESTE